MPINITPQVVTALNEINKNPERYTRPKPNIPLETRINDLKETNPRKYKECLTTLVASANSGNEKARVLLGKIGEDAARERRGGEQLNKAMYIPTMLAAGSLLAPGAAWIYNQLPQWIRTGIGIGLTIDGARNLFSNNGWQKTKRDFDEGNYTDAVLSGISDTLDMLACTSLAKRIGRGLITRFGNRIM